MEIKNLVEEIKNWDRKDIKVLKEKLEELDTAITNMIINDPVQNEVKLADYIDLSSLPSEPFNALEGHEDAPIWAIDKNRMALVGEFTIESEKELLEWFE